MRSWILVLNLIMTCFRLWGAESISGNDGTYRNICLKAVEDSWYFQNFRSLSDYTHIVEVAGGRHFADYINKYASKEIRGMFAVFEKLDYIGNPPTSYFPGIGTFSGTTLRYIIVANHIRELFSLPNNAAVVEIGAGFGGQCYILSQLQSFSNYYIYDLPEVEALIDKVMGVLHINQVNCLPMDYELPDESIDLVISNYAFSECTRETQLNYFNNVIKKSKRGYIIYNQITARVFGLDYLSPAEFVTLLKQNGKNPKVYSEPVPTDIDNLLIIWGNDR